MSEPFDDDARLAQFATVVADFTELTRHCPGAVLSDLCPISLDRRQLDNISRSHRMSLDAAQESLCAWNLRAAKRTLDIVLDAEVRITLAVGSAMCLTEWLVAEAAAELDGPITNRVGAIHNRLVQLLGEVPLPPHPLLPVALAELVEKLRDDSMADPPEEFNRSKASFCELAMGLALEVASLATPDLERLLKPLGAWPERISADQLGVHLAKQKTAVAMGRRLAEIGAPFLKRFGSRENVIRGFNRLQSGARRELRAGQRHLQGQIASLRQEHAARGPERTPSRQEALEKFRREPEHVVTLQPTELAIVRLLGESLTPIYQAGLLASLAKWPPPNEHINYGVSTVRKHIERLMKIGYVVKVGERKGYALSSPGREFFASSAG